MRIRRGGCRTVDSCSMRFSARIIAASQLPVGASHGDPSLTHVWHTFPDGGACYATDVGGFLGPPDPELYVRWTQAAIFASHLRFHGTSPREQKECISEVEGFPVGPRARR